MEKNSNGSDLKLVANDEKKDVTNTMSKKQLLDEKTKDVKFLQEVTDKRLKIYIFINEIY